MAIAPETVDAATPAEEVELVIPEFTDEQLTGVELTKTQQNTINDLKKVMKQPQIEELIVDFKKANLVKQQSGERRLREASTEFTKQNAVIFALVSKKDSDINKIAADNSIEVTAIPNIIREIKSKLYTILMNEGQINKTTIGEYLQKHATAEPRKKRDKKVAAAGDTSNVAGTEDPEDNDDDNENENSVIPEFTPEELAALEAEEN